MKVFVGALAFMALLAVAYSMCPAVDGDDAVLLADRRSCSSFFICSNGTPYRFVCPAGLEFNRRLRVCDWPASAGCRRGPRPPTSTWRPNRPRDAEVEETDEE